MNLISHIFQLSDIFSRLHTYIGLGIDQRTNDLASCPTPPHSRGIGGAVLLSPIFTTVFGAGFDIFPAQ